MRQDPHLRYPNDPGPVVMGQKDLRYAWAPPGDPSTLKLRQDGPEEAKGLFVVYMGDTGLKSLVEAYYPEDIRPEYYRLSLDPVRRSELQLGRLVVINEMWSFAGELTDQDISDIKAGSRNTRSELRRSHSKFLHQLALENAEAQRTKGAVDRWVDFYVNACQDSHKFAMGKVHVSQYSPSRGR